MTRRTILLLCLLAAACDSETTAPESYSIQVVSGADQSAAAAAPLTQPIVVRLMDASGAPVVGAQVQWRVIEGGGTVSESTTVTDANGRATVQWTLGFDVGQQLLLATSNNASYTVKANAIFRVAAVAAGYHHTCAISTAGGAYCWGTNDQFQLGDNSARSSSSPVRVATLVRFNSITTAWSHTCGLSITGHAFCWGDNSVGQLGIATVGGSFSAPVPVATPDAFTSISAGFVHTCAVTATGDVECWGTNPRGQLGGVSLNRARINGLQFRSVAAGEFHSCGVRADNTVFCWGWNSFGELGTGAPFGAAVATPAQVKDSAHYSVVAAGVRHTCAVGTTGSVWCWGLNGAGETGFDQFVNLPTPGLMVGTAGYTSVGIGNDHTCGLSGGRAFCWGSLLGDGTSNSSKTPVAVSGGRQYSSISVGYQHTCAVSDGEVWCWGSNSHGQLGQAGSLRSAVPVRVVFDRP
jgi:alpha-tubulin suppressor-like RCC1 family protein